VDAVETGCWFLQRAGTRCGIVNGILHDSDGERKKRKKKKMKEKRTAYISSFARDITYRGRFIPSRLPLLRRARGSVLTLDR